MSEKLKACPVCGANEWKFVSGKGLSEYYCLFCHTSIPAIRINRRIIQWVPVEERLPKAGVVVFCKMSISYTVYFCVGRYDNKWLVRNGDGYDFDDWITPSATVTHWLDDKT